MIVWGSYLEFGHPEIDGQHRILAEVINELHVAARAHAGRKEVEAILLRLKDNTEAHFRSEEEFMGRSQYQGAVEHQTGHSALLRKLDELVEGYRKGEVGITTMELHSLQDWLVTHIVKEDRHLVKFLRAQQGGATIAEPGAIPSGQESTV